MQKKIIPMLAAGCLAMQPSWAKIVHLLPQPQQVEARAAAAPFALGRAVSLSDPTACPGLTRFLEATGCTVAPGSAATVTVRLVGEIDGAYDYDLAGFPAEGYRLTVSADAIEIEALTETGVMRAAQTLAQLAEGYDGTPAVEALAMTDWPAFKLRGFMHDVGRSFVTVEEIKKELDLLSRFKVNVFHWHLTENQAWRFQVNAYPQLTEASAMTRFAGQYYTQEQCREVEAYAAERGIVVIPEIDMPGHSEAFERAMGHSMQTDKGVAELKVILEEVAAVFSRAPYIHIGADEKTITYANFLSTMIGKVHELGKKVVVWNPISGVTISKDAGIDMTQMWSTSGRKVAGIPNIDCRYNYTNHFDVFADVVGIYKSTVYYEQRGSTEVAGLISAAWNDRKTPAQEDIVRQNNIYANILASAERGWMGGGKQYIETGGVVLPNSGEEYDAFADWERRFLFHKAHSLKDEPIPYVRQTNVRWRITDAFPNGGNADLQLPPETEGLKESYEYGGQTYATGMATGAGIYLRHTWGATVPAYFDNPQTNTTAYAWTYVYSPTARTVGALVEFQNYGRSENDLAPEAGRWDRKGSRLYVNDEEILPPAWDNTGVSVNSEVDLRNENLTARPPVSIELKAGWNKVFMKLPYNPTSGVRLSKWMFTFVLTDTEGRDALDDVVYSPNQYLDEAADQLSAVIGDIRRLRNASIGTAPGFYDASCAASLDAALSAVEATLDQEMSAEERAAQVETLSRELAAFEAALAAAEPIQPEASTAERVVPYVLSTPLRENRYATAKGDGADIVGEAAPSAASAWKFERRADGTFDIRNVADGTYVSPASGYNTALRAVSAQPSAGWTLKPADETGYFIITSGTVQFNQTHSGLGYKLYNWGGGTNTTDAGCKYRVAEAEPVAPVELPDPVLTVTGLALDGSAPYRVPDAYAAPVLEAPALTVAVDFTRSSQDSPSSLAAAVNTDVSDAYCSVALVNNNAFGIRYDDRGGQYTTPATLSGRHRAVIVADRDAGRYDYYYDGAFKRDVTGLSASFPGFSTVEGRNALYLGGFVTADNGNKYPFAGTIHSARFYAAALTAEQVAALDYDNPGPSTGIVAAASGSGLRVVNGRIVSSRPFRVYGLDGRRVSGADRLVPGVYVVWQDGAAQKVLLR